MILLNNVAMLYCLHQEEQTQARMARCTEAYAKHVEDLLVAEKELLDMQDRHRKSKYLSLPVLRRVLIEACRI